MTKKQTKRGASATDAAEHFGITRQALYQWERKGWLVRHSDRSVDLPATAARVAQYRHEDGRTTALEPSASKVEPETVPAPEVVDLVLGSVPDTPMAELQRIKEYWTSRQRALDVRHREGELVDAAEVRRAYTDFSRTLRDRILSASSSLAIAAIQAGTDPVRVEAAITDGLHALLTELSEEPPEVTP